MSFLNPLILYGLPLVGIPILLHLLMRSKPKKLLFPALRLIEARRKSNVRRMRLRHIWLLLLRVTVISLLLLALARPSLPAANYGPNLREWLTLAVIGVAAVATYLGVMRHWRQKRCPNHVLTYRRTVLRGGTAGAVVVLFLLLVAWPYQRRIAAEIAAPLPAVNEHLPVAGVLLFDTTLSMQYRLQNKTRLDRAREVAAEHLRNLPSRSRVAVADTSGDNPILFQADLASAQARIDNVEIHPVSHSLDGRLRAALRLQEEDRQRTLDLQDQIPADVRQDRYLREVYIFTDLARSAWKTSAAQALREELARLDWVQVYLIDVGVSEPRNIALTSLRLSKQTLPSGGTLVVRVSVTATSGESSERGVELLVETDGGKLVEQGQDTVQLAPDAPQEVAFTLQDLSGPIVRGEVRLTSSDPLSSDDVRYFTVEVRPPPEVLVVAPSRLEALYWMEALAPTELVRQQRARYRATYLPDSRLEAAADLDRYDVVCLINVSQPSERAWEKLASYVAGGGGLAVVLGMPNNPDQPPPVSYNAPAAQSFLPAELLAELPFQPPEFIDLKNLSHPILAKFDEYPSKAALLSASEVRRFWRVQPADEAAVIARFTDRRRSPALLERIHGEGRTVLLTTAVDLKLRTESWNDLPLAQWQFVALADQMMQYLGQRSDAVLNYTAGDEVVLLLDRNQPLRRYLLRKPALQQLPGEIEPGSSSLVIREADQIGHYELISAEPDIPFAGGFSVNPPPAESDLTRLVAADLDLLLGEGRYSVAPSIEELQRIVTRGRIGQEVFPLVLLVMVFAFCAELLVANRFYEADQATSYK